MNIFKHDNYVLYFDFGCNAHIILYIHWVAVFLQLYISLIIFFVYLLFPFYIVLAQMLNLKITVELVNISSPFQFLYMFFGY